MISKTFALTTLALAVIGGGSYQAYDSFQQSNADSASCGMERPSCGASTYQQVVPDPTTAVSPAANFYAAQATTQLGAPLAAKSACPASADMPDCVPGTPACPEMSTAAAALSAVVAVAEPVDQGCCPTE